jgi:hypothetical protein
MTPVTVNGWSPMKIAGRVSHVVMPSLVATPEPIPATNSPLLTCASASAGFVTSAAGAEPPAPDAFDELRPHRHPAGEQLLPRASVKTPTCS